MAPSKLCKSIPELYDFVLEEYGKEINRLFLFKKVEGKYEGISYPDLKEETDSFAYGLSALGISNDDKISLISENRPEWIYSDLAMLSLNAINVPLYPSLTADSIQFILNNSESKAIIVSNKFQLNKILKIKNHCKHLKFIIVINEKDTPQGENFIYSFKEVQAMGKKLRETKPDFLIEQRKKAKENDVCTIIYTSGTTGEPKGVMLSHKNILSNVYAALQCFPISKEDSFLSFLPLCHIFERMTGYYTAFAAGCSIYYAESIESVAQNLIEVKPTIMTTVPRLFERIYSKILKNVESQPEKKQKIFYWAINVGKEYMTAKKKGNVSVAISLKNKLANKLVFKKLQEKTGGKLRFFVSGGAALPRVYGEFFEAVGLTIIEGYGLTESSPVIAANRLDDYKFGTVGKVIPGVEVKIASDGEILAKGPNIMHGYYKNRKETEEVLKDGWLYTGDIGVFDADGFLMITDRKKHLFKTSQGKYIAPAPIESLFLTSKYIDQFMLIGDRRTYLSALIVPDFEAIKEYADRNNIPYKGIEELIAKKEIYDLVDKELGKFQKSLANYERVRKFKLLEEPFSLENGEITPSLKIKRKFVEERYSNLIDEMYSEN